MARLIDLNAVALLTMTFSTNIQFKRKPPKMRLIAPDYINNDNNIFRMKEVMRSKYFEFKKF